MHVKINSAQASVIAARGATVIRTLSEKVASLEAENQTLRSTLEDHTRTRQVHELAQEMEDKGLNAHLSFDEKVAHLSRTSDLDSVRHAVAMVSSGGIPFAKVADAPSTGGVDTLTALCLGAD